MNRIRRTAVLLGLATSVVVGSTVPASATFSEPVTTAATLRAITVAPPTGLVPTTICTTATTTVTKTVYTDPATGAKSTTSSNSSTARTTSSSNVQGTTTQTVAGPGANETTTTTVTKNTDMSVSLRWTGSSTRGVTGYVVSAYLGVNGSATPLVTTGSGTTSVTQTQDADALAYSPSLLVTTQTSYGWTATSARTAVLSC